MLNGRQLGYKMILRFLLIVILYLPLETQEITNRT